FFKTERAKDLLLNGTCEINDLLKILVGDELFYEQYLFDQQFSHQGWSGMVTAIEMQPEGLLDRRKITLRELIVFELLLEIDALDFKLGNSWKPLAKSVALKSSDLFSEVKQTEKHEVYMLWQEAFEWSFYDQVLAGLKSEMDKKKEMTENKEVSFQAMFCIDERECSFRRHVEYVDSACVTLSAPGFFGVEFFMQPQNAKFYDKLCPAPVTPKFLIKEFDVKSKRGHELIYTNKTHTFSGGFLSALTLGFFAGIKLVQTIFRPRMSPAISNAFSHMHKDGQLTIENKSPEDRENGLQIGFTIEEMTVRVEGLLRSIGLVKNFATIVYVIGHGSSSANNPHHGAHDCGACSGRPGSVNARVFAFMANHIKVRSMLKERGIEIPDETQFVGGLHDTAADQIEFYDEQVLAEKNAQKHKNNLPLFEKALDLNAKERSRRFASIDTKKSRKHVRKEILKRSVSMFEPRPEYGHGTNTLCIIAPRSLTKGLFLDRRAFLNSYDYRTDPDGKLLTGVMRPIGLVCGGINLEYYFSRVDNYKLGAGTKLPHNVMGLIGVANSVDGDLRPGLPLQMIEVHDPVRLLVIVEHFPEMVLKAIQSTPEIYEWYINEWVNIVAVNPETQEFFIFRNGSFTKYIPLQKTLESKTDFEPVFEAEHEHLPVYSIK
ncbi:MAG: DUF2309 domain-containing protein, partial [Bacteroidia bacterium]|nr:DUF2309 domain-containing protein [Bacteroidia bacterium]